jgi:predicted acetyltransferase
MVLSIRTLSEDDLRPISEMLHSAFLSDLRESDVQRERTVFEPDRWHGIQDGDELIGTGGILTRDITLPGAGPHPFAAVTAVGVKPGHRRRGVLNLLMRTQLHGLHDEGREAVAGLWASEGSIYGRFGYGVAAEFTRLSVPRGSEFHSGVDTGTDRVREIPRDGALPLMKDVYKRIAPRRTGWLSRSDPAWEYNLSDPEHRRGGLTAFRFVVHPRGYAVYRVKPDWQDRGPAHEVHVRELTAEDDQAYAALYRYLLDVDLVGVLKFVTASDDPVVHMLANPRLALRSNADSLWIRLVDLDRALTQRRYPSDVDTVIEVTDDLCPWNAGRWRLTVKAGEAHVQRVPDDPDLAVDIAALGAAFLGGTRLTTLARAQRARELTPGAVDALSHAFLGDREPHCPELF